MTDPPILVGLRLGDGGYRDRNWAYSKAHWERTLGWPIFEGHYDDPGPFSLARASNRAAKLAGDWEVAFYVGADFILDDRRQAKEAVELAQQTGLLVLAHDRLVQLDEHETEWLIAGDQPFAATGVRHPNTFSGALAVPRKLWDEVGGFDERFVGWGFDDIAFWASCWAVGGGFRRVDGLMYHLWHPRSRADNEESPEYPANSVLGNRYLEAKGNREAMLAIIAERP